MDCTYIALFQSNLQLKMVLHCKLHLLFNTHTHTVHLSLYNVRGYIVLFSLSKTLTSMNVLEATWGSVS